MFFGGGKGGVSGDSSYYLLVGITRSITSMICCCLSPLQATKSGHTHTDHQDLFVLSGFFQVSYASADFDLRIAGGPYIYKGFMLKGRVNILGWEIFAHVKMSDVVGYTVRGNLTN